MNNKINKKKTSAVHLLQNFSFYEKNLLAIKWKKYSHSNPKFTECNYSLTFGSCVLTSSNNAGLRSLSCYKILNSGNF